ncbi:gliding motility-associated C-terminal domain-containing protein [Dokdonia sp. Hel_I_53]|uniref:T9SS type B sorting domain-containing protein n=1 Tax=Dokdonia sp. Hel_I_53 TaxID=1566287 RepID=UPI00119A752F|nr:gliding motility-associated C-terminal domain-containing protein [Dokdonia sp. Hel_I_53]TVZ50978.1 gliding motility-associated-like protein [Dokdonia sp. Hel_I_53]
MGKLYFFLILLLITSVTSYSQCAEEVTYVVCDMTTVDDDGDSIPDGIINLYEELSAITGTTINDTDGMFLDPDFNFALDPGGNGDLYLWNLDNSSEFESSYQFQFLDSSSGCPDDIRYLFNIVLGPFAGTPTPQSGSSSANITVCEAGLIDFDLFQVFESNPAPHENGVWAFIGNDGDPTNFQFLSQEGRFSATIPYSPNDGSLVDSDVFEFTYTVEGIAPCAAEDVSTFRVEVVRDIQSGSPGSEFLCQSEMVAGGTWDRNISLATEYLANEDVEGTWSSDFDPSGQISGPGDDTINLYQAYLDYVTTFGPAIGCLSFSYTYTVEPRINLADCNEKESTITFTISEEIRPFSQTVAYEICEDAESPVSLDLYDQLEFTTEVWNNPSTGMDQNVLFDYPNDNCTNWELISGPSTLGILNNTGRVPGNSTIDWCSAFINGIGYTTNYRSRGRISFAGADPGTYVFRYTVLPSYHCQIVGSCNTDASCTHPCDIQTADVVVVIHPKNYAGEDTTDIEENQFCESDGTLVLTDLLNTNGTDTVYVGPDGVWTDLDTQTTIDNNFTIPEITTVTQDFNFEYNTITDEGCTDAALLSFRVFQQYDPGMDSSVDVCRDGGEIDLFTLIAGTPDTNGSWTGPDGYTSDTNTAPFDPSTNTTGDYIYTVPDNGLCLSAQAIITVSIGDADYAGEDVSGVELCDSAGSVNLFDLLDPDGTANVTQGGEFTDASNTVISNPFVFPAIDTQQTYEFTYTTTSTAGCTDQAILNFTVFEQKDAGIDAITEYCENEDMIVNLFSLLNGTPDDNGDWTGPDNYSASGSSAEINPTTAVSGVYTYSFAEVGGCAASTATVTVTVYEEVTAGAEINTSVCPGDYTLFLSDLLEDGATLGGEFIDLDTMLEVPGGTVEVASLGENTFSYLYIVENGTCPQDDTTITFTITARPEEPTVSNVAEFYCINDGITLGDLNVEGADEFAWFAFAEAGEELPLSTLLVDGEVYYLAALDDSGCESNRVPYEASVRPLSNDSCQIDITNGVSDNDDGINDDLSLGSLPDVFPNFDIQIFNRYGTIVYKGNRNTPLFNGSANTGSSLGNQLPTGVYFYIFYPNDMNSAPIDGTFYLSR